MTGFLKIERDGHVVTLTLNRPKKRNAISSAEECAEVADACRTLNRDGNVRVVIVTGAGTSFCAGGDLKGMRDRTGITKGDTGALTVIVILFIISALVVWGTSYLQTYLTNWVGQRALQDLRLDVFRHLQEMPVAFYERRPAGVLISRLTNDVEALESMVTDSVTTLFQASLTLVGSIVILLLFDVELALLTFLIFPVLAVGSFAFRLASADAFSRTRGTIGALTAYLQESLSGIRVLKSYAQEPRHGGVFAGLNAQNRSANMTTVNLNAAYFPSVEFVSAIATVGILLYGGHQVLSGDVTVGVLVGFIAALNGFFDPPPGMQRMSVALPSV